MSVVEQLPEAASPEDPLKLVEAAVLAPSAHNSQPWRFALARATVRIFPDRSRRRPVADPEDRELFVSLGCALENLVIAARAAGYEPAVTLFPRGEPDGCLRVDLAPAAAPVEGGLADAIARRQTNRHHYDGRPIPPDDLARLAAVPAEPGVLIRVFTAAAALDTVAELVRRADEAQLDDEGFRQELAGWIRFSGREAAARGDGLAPAVLEVPEVPRWIGEWGLPFVLTGEREGVKDARLVRSSSAVALVTTAADDRRAWVAAGRSFERFALTAATLGVQLAPLCQPCEVPSLRAELAERLEATGRAQLLARLGFAPPPARSPRRPVEAVLEADGAGTRV